MAKNRGFSLLETLMGLLILSTMMVGVTSLWINHQRIFRQSRNHLIAQYVLQSEMERCVGSGYHELDDLVGEPPQVYTVTRKFKGSSQISTFETDLELTSNAEESLRKVRATVIYDQPQVGQKQLKMETDVFWTQ